MEDMATGRVVACRGKTTWRQAEPTPRREEQIRREEQAGTLSFAVIPRRHCPFLVPAPAQSSWHSYESRGCLTASR